MRFRLGLVAALLMASCAPQRPSSAPLPVQPPPAAPVPAPVIPPTDSAAPLTQAPAAPAVAVVKADSIALAKQARDSALDAAMLDRVATAHPPEAVAAPAVLTGAEAEAAALRAMFDIDVANWADHDRVKYYLDFFTGPARERMVVWLQRMPRYEPTFRAQLVARGLPGDLAYLPLIESGYSSTAVSRSRAVGMWQFMRATGKYYGLTIDSWLDERRDVVRATDAAIRYLADLTTRFGSPYLAAAAYNGGPGRIQRGLKRIDPITEEPVADDSTAEEVDESGPQAGDAAFFQLADTRYLKRETKDYVPKLIAAALIAKQPERYGFPSVPQNAVEMLDSVVVSEATGLDVIARLAGVSLADLWAANPAFVRAVTPPKRRAVVRVPPGSASSTQTALEALPASERLTSFAHHAKAGETISRIAKRYGLGTADVRGFNPEFKTRAPRAGEVVRIPGQARLAGWISESRRVEGELAGGSTHKVRKGETLGSIALRYRVSVAQLRAVNELSPRALLRIGQVLRIGPRKATAAPRPAPRTTATRAASSSSSARVHVVKTGDTLSSLARRYGVTVQALRAVNSLSAGQILPTGRKLTIPS